MLILSEISTQSAVHGSAVIHPNNELLCLALLVGTRHAFNLYKVQINNLEYLQSISLENKVLAFTTVNIDEQDIIIFVDETFHIGLIVVDPELKVSIKIMSKLSTKGQVQAFEYPPQIIPDKQKNPTSIAFHVFHSTIHVLQLKNPINVTDIIETKTSKKRKHGNPDSWWSIDTIPIGRIIVKQIISLNIPEKTLAILYKDISSTFYVRYWQINADSKPSRMVRQFPEFQEEPLLIIPMTVGGHIALTRSAIFYFPEKKIHNLTVSKEVQDVTVSDKSNQLYFVKSLVLRNSKVDEQNYISYEIIDEHRILLTSQSGKSNMLYIDLESSSTSTIIINQVSMISLGDVTIPNSNGLHHITGDLFFQSSRLSRSVLFLVSPIQPHIHIKAFIDGSPPVLDITPGPKEVYTCQGGWLGSEIRKYFTGMSSFVIVKSIKLGFKPESIRFIDETIMLQNTLYGTHILNTSDLKPPQGIKELSEQQIMYFQDHADGEQEKYIPEMKTRISWNESKNIKLQSDNKIIEFTSNGDFVPSSVDAVTISKDECLVLVTSSLGVFEIWRHGTRDIHKVYEGCLEEDHVIVDSLIVLADKSGNVSIILLTIESWWQVNFSRDIQNGLREVNRHSQKVYGNAYLVRKWKDNIVLFNDRYLVPLKRDILLGFYLPSHFPSTGIDDIGVFLDNKVVVVYSNGLIDKLDMKHQSLLNISTHQSIFSRNLFIKSLLIKDTNYLIGLLYNKMDEYNGLCRNELHLFDSGSLEPMDVYKLGDGEEILDICQLPADVSQNRFVCLMSSSDTPVFMFGVEEGRIVKLQTNSIMGLELTDEFKLNSLSIFNESENIYLCSGNISFLMTLDDDLEWKVIPKTVTNSTTLTMSQSVLFNDIYTVDAIDGLFRAKVNDDMSFENQLRFTKVNIDGYTHGQMTSIATFSKAKYSYIITGDAHGNVVLVKTSVIDSLDQKVIRFNVGDQINTIVQLGIEQSLTTKICAIGTLLGELYILNETNHDDNDILECWDELKSYSNKSHLPSLSFREQASDNILETESTECNDIIDARSISSILKEIIANPHGISSSHKKLIAKKYKLQQLYVEVFS